MRDFSNGTGAESQTQIAMLARSSTNLSSTKRTAHVETKITNGLLPRMVSLGVLLIFLLFCVAATITSCDRAMSVFPQDPSRSLLASAHLISRTRHTWDPQATDSSRAILATRRLVLKRTTGLRSLARMVCGHMCSSFQCLCMYSATR